MKNNFFSSPRTSLLIFTLGIILTGTLAAGLVWAGLEAEFYGFDKLGDDRIENLSCPPLMTLHETAAIRASFRNPTDKDIQPMVRADISTRSVTHSERTLLPIAVGQTETVEWSISQENVDLGRFVFARVYRYPTYQLRMAQATCGILVLDVPLVSGLQLFSIWLVAGLGGIAFGLVRWEAGHNGNDGVSLNARRAVRTLAVVTLLALWTGVQGAWLPGIVALALLILLSVTVAYFLIAR